MQQKTIEDELASIRSLMERSSKFISLSGLAGILAGAYALAGAGAAYYVVQARPVKAAGFGIPFFDALSNAINQLYELSLIALAVLIASIITAILLSVRKAKKNGHSVWGKTSRALLFNMAIPLLSGGGFILALLYQGHFDLVVAAMLVFYGLALINAGNFTFTDVRYLGLTEIILGLIVACIPQYSLLFWAIGFGVLHVLYGSVMYLKYDR